MSAYITSGSDQLIRAHRGRVNPTRNENRPNLYRFGSVLGSVLFTDWVGVWNWEIWQVWVWVWIQLCCDYRFGFGFGFNLLYRLGWVLDLWKFTGSDLGLGSIYQTGWVGFRIWENIQVWIWVWVQFAIQVGLGFGFVKIHRFGFGFGFNLPDRLGFRIWENTWVSVTGLCLISKTGLVSSSVSNNKLVTCQLATKFKIKIWAYFNHFKRVIGAYFKKSSKFKIKSWTNYKA